MFKFIDYILHLDKYLVYIIQNYGILTYLLLFIIIFLETGLVITPFLPGDSLLFVSGTLASTGALSLIFLLILFSAAAILGDTLNYWLGSYLGVKVFSKLIKQEHLEKTKEFYKKHGKKTIIIARFIPIIRTFAPFVAGIGKMSYLQFLAFNVIGGLLWVFLFVLSGFYFGNIPLIKNNLTIVIFIIIFLSLLPIIIEIIRSRRKN